MMRNDCVIWDLVSSLWRLSRQSWAPPVEMPHSAQTCPSNVGVRKCADRFTWCRCQAFQCDLLVWNSFTLCRCVGHRRMNVFEIDPTHREVENVECVRYCLNLQCE